MSFSKSWLCPVVAAVFALTAHAQTTFSFAIDQANSNFTWNGTSSLGPILGNPSNTFQLTGAQNLDLVFQAGAQPFASGAFSAGGVVATSVNLHGKIPSGIPGFNLATIDVNGLTMQATSPSFAIGGGGAFSASVTLTALGGTLVVTPAVGAPTNTALAGNSSLPTTVNGAVTLVGGNYHLVAPINSAFAFSDPGTGATGSISLVGTITADHPFLKSFCVGDGTGTACPCANNSPVGQGRGCVHSGGAGARLAASGVPSLANDTLVLTGTSQPPGTLGLYFQGGSLLAGQNGIAFGDGLLCLGTIARMAVKAAPAGSSTFPIAGDPSISVSGAVGAAPAIRYYQLWYRDSAVFCTGATYNLTNAMQVQWMP